MKLIIAGSRGFMNGDLFDDDERVRVVDHAIRQWGDPDDVQEVVSGTADGGDYAGECWAEANGIPIERFPAKWDNTDHPDAIVREGKYGKYNARAGFIRNQTMVDYADGLVALWDGESSGTKDTIDRAHEQLDDDLVYVHRY